MAEIRQKCREKCASGGQTGGGADFVNILPDWPNPSGHQIVYLHYGASTQTSNNDPCAGLRMLQAD